LGEKMKNITECCRVNAIVTIDSRGQIVLPKDVRDKAKIKPNDKLAIIGCEREGEICCIVMVKAEKLRDAVSRVLGPMLKDVLK